MAPEPEQPTLAGGAPDVTPGAHPTGRRPSGWATSFEHWILCPQAHEEAAEALFYLLPSEDHGPGGSAPRRVWIRSVQTPGIPLPLALFFFRGGVTRNAEHNPGGSLMMFFPAAAQELGFRLTNPNRSTYTAIRLAIEPIPKPRETRTSCHRSPTKPAPAIGVARLVPNTAPQTQEIAMR